MRLLKYLHTMFLSVLFVVVLVFGKAFACTTGASYDIAVQKSDVVFSPMIVAKGAYSQLEYDQGAVWLRARDGHSELLYKPDEETSVQNGQHFCFSKDFDVVKNKLPPGMAMILEKVAKGSGLFALCSDFKGTPVKDVACTVISGIKSVLSGEMYRRDGELCRYFESWARFSPGFETKGSDVVIADFREEGEYGPGSVWVTINRHYRILCYRPEFGPAWMCYRFDLNKMTSEWPKDWHYTFGVIMELCVLNRPLRSLSVDKVEFLGCVVRAALSGRAACWNEPVWLAWKRVRRKDRRPILAQNVRLFAGTYQDHEIQKGSAWVVHRRGTIDPVLRTCSHDDVVFQYAPMQKKPPCCTDILCGVAELQALL